MSFPSCRCLNKENQEFMKAVDESVITLDEDVKIGCIGERLRRQMIASYIMQHNVPPQALSNRVIRNYEICLTVWIVTVSIIGITLIVLFALNIIPILPIADK